MLSADEYNHAVSLAGPNPSGSPEMTHRNFWLLRVALWQAHRENAALKNQAGVIVSDVERIEP